MRVGIVTARAVDTNADLVVEWTERGLDVEIVPAESAVEELGAGDVALLRLDILPTLDGFEAGLGCVPGLRRAGVRILNPPWALLGAHDKLETARRLGLAELPHPRSRHVTDPQEHVDLGFPVVVKPRFGSWGRDITRCPSPEELHDCLTAVADRSWFVRHGALVQEYVPGRRLDLRIVVAGGRVAGAARREPAAGEWRTNVSLGGHLHPVVPDERARTLALEAVRAVGGDLVGVDLIQLDGDYVVLELNGAVDFEPMYSQPGANVYDEVAEGLGLAPARERTWASLPG